MKKLEPKRGGRLPVADKSRKVSLTFRESLLAHAEARATATGESLSGFIGSLIEADMSGTPALPMENRVARLEHRMDVLEKRP